MELPLGFGRGRAGEGLIPGGHRLGPLPGVPTRAGLVPEPVGTLQLSEETWGAESESLRVWARPLDVAAGSPLPGSSFQMGRLPPPLPLGLGVLPIPWRWVRSWLEGGGEPSQLRSQRAVSPTVGRRGLTCAGSHGSLGRVRGALEALSGSIPSCVMRTRCLHGLGCALEVPGHTP